MPSRKKLKSVAHNFGDSFLSLLNFVETDYLMGLLLAEMRKTGYQTLRIDILAKQSEPEALVTTQILKSIENYTDWFPKLVEKTGSSMGFVKSAIMTIEFDLTTTRPYPHDTRYIENPFVCTVVITDDHGKDHLSEQKGWWFPEYLNHKTSRKKWYQRWW